MNCQRVPSTFYTVRADNGDPLLLYGLDEDRNLFLWATPFICRHPVAFGRWCRQHIEEFRGCRFVFNHPLSQKVRRWAEWLNVSVESGVA